MTDWVEVRRRTRRKSRKMVQIFVKVDGGKTSAMEMEMNDKVDDIVKKIPISDQDVYVTSGGRILRRSDKLESCEVQDGSTIQVTSRMRGGGRHKDKKSKVEKKQVARQEPVRNEGSAILVNDKEAVIQMLEENEGYRKIVKMISERSDEDYGMQCFRAELHEKSGLDEDQMKVLECGIRWAVEARRKERGEEKRRQEQEEQRRQAEQGQITEQEQSKQGKTNQR